MTNRVPKPKFFISMSAKSLVGDDGVERVPVSSTNYDRDGDRMTESFLESMKNQINNGHVALYADHGMGKHGYYSVFDKLGHWDEAIVINGMLYARPVFSEVSGVSDEVEMLKEMMGSDTPTAFSISFIGQEFQDGNEKGGWDFSEGDLLEISPVGLPANPDAIEHSMRAFRKFYKSIQVKEMGESDDIKTLDEAMMYLTENGTPEKVMDIIMENLKDEKQDDDEEDEDKEDDDDEEEEEEDKAGDEEDEEDEEDEDKEDDEDEEEEEDKGCDDDEDKELDIPITWKNIAKMIEVVIDVKTQAMGAEPKEIAPPPTPKGHSPKGPGENNPSSSAFKKP